MSAIRISVLGTPVHKGPPPEKSLDRSAHWAPKGIPRAWPPGPPTVIMLLIDRFPDSHAECGGAGLLR